MSMTTIPDSTPVTKPMFALRQRRHHAFITCGLVDAS
jgi:hypothetical protein